MNIAVVGGGISGLSAAYFLSKKHSVTLFEKEERLGGHAHTIVVELHGRTYSIDTGFMGFSEKTYPMFTKLLSALDVQTQPMPLHFSVSIDNGAFEYSSYIPRGIIAQPSNIIRLSFWNFIFEILRFNRAVHIAHHAPASTGKTLGTFLDELRLSKTFRTHYLYPMAGSIWSTPQTEIEKFPSNTLIKFFMNHGLASLRPPLAWRSITNGSKEYVESLLSTLRDRGVEIRLKQEVAHISRNNDGIELKTNASVEKFDAVILATHANQTLKLLSDPSDDETKILQTFQYQKNVIVVHSDRALMPKRKGVWATWNFRGTSTCCLASEVSLTYDMRAMHQISDDVEIFVTLNPDRSIDTEKMFKTFQYDHPLYTNESESAQKLLPRIQGNNQTYFCGSYFGYGFHEDGIVAALQIAKQIGVEDPW